MDLSFLSGIFASPWNIIRNLLDIAIVAYVFYRLLKLIAGTRAQQLLKGLLLLLVFSVAASFLKLDMVNWLVEKLWIVFAITLPIVFQPELRRLLEQIGRGGFFTSRRLSVDKNIYTKIIYEVCEAAKLLAKDRTGALILFTRDTGIAEYTESGVNIDAVVSASLLLNIFTPNSPLHDGAVVINGGRLEKAACFLPLSDNPSLSRDLGTRHRAAIGITEISDVIAVIVSEETGAISIAIDGKLNRHLDTFKVKEILTSELADKLKINNPLFRRWASAE
ncbi:MAG: TIGR00159 family protein [Syntrophomonadaceae bacterium]|nr:TIGR00159 family protein [Syntrophomonadaceae bacterium]